MHFGTMSVFWIFIDINAVETTKLSWKNVSFMSRKLDVFFFRSTLNVWTTFFQQNSVCWVLCHLIVLGSQKHRNPKLISESSDRHVLWLPFALGNAVLFEWASSSSSVFQLLRMIWAGASSFILHNYSITVYFPTSYYNSYFKHYISY